MDTKLDIYLCFPVDEYTEPEFAKLVKYCGSVEDVEHNFGIEFSCGDGKYYGDFYRSSPNGHSLSAIVSDEELEKYDGKVCTDTPPRLVPIKMSHVEEPMKANKTYRFTIKYVPKFEQEVYYISGKERGRKWVS